ncbi:hypothetical protein [Helcococcus sueciensis]|uniref:hypothetical protein n=1 Tax=Helcococcus sueciensis TaxID=241555 RepID=UPI0012EB290B|nr:hypothetical protein [Helcococcus sueciensis]
MKFNKRVYSLIFIANLAFLMGFNYLIGNSFYNNKYNMPKDYLEFEKVNDSDFNLDELKNYKDINIIAETNDETIIGLYNPDNNYYINSSKILNADIFRYFSNDDYIQNKNVSIYIGSIRDLMQKSEIDFTPLENRFNTEIINYFDYDASIYENDIILVKNLFSIDSNEITKLYVFSENGDIDSSTINLLKSNFKLIKKSNLKMLKDAFNIFLFGRLYEKIISTSLISILLILFFSIIIFSNSKKKDVYINKIYGADSLSFLINFIRINVFYLFIIFIASDLVVLLYLTFIATNYLVLSNMIFLNIILLILIFLITAIKTIIMFKAVDEEGAKYVL